MTPRPIYRWKSFWLGLFVVCFLAWAWWDSYRVGSGLSLEGRGRKIWCVHAGGKLRFYAEPVHVRLFRLEVEYEGKFAREIALRSWLTGGEESIVRVPDGLVILSFGGLWLGGLAWRARMERRHAHRMADHPVE